MMYLLDTDTFIFLLRGSSISNPKSERDRERKAMAGRISNRCQLAIAAEALIGLSAISLAELDYGARRSNQPELNLQILRETLSPFAAFDFDAVDCVGHYGEIRHELEQAGTIIGEMDLLIAAHAKALGAILVTNNTREFSRVRDLKCENWTS